ncbi:MucBP domain-containing protein, partial [Enterococcus faecalis]
MKKEKALTILSLLVLTSTPLLTASNAFAESEISSNLETKQEVPSQSKTNSTGITTINGKNEEDTTESNSQESTNSSDRIDLKSTSARSLDNTGISLSAINLNKEVNSQSLVSLTYSIKTTSEKGIEKGDSIVLNIPGTGLNYESIDIQGLPSYFTQSIDAVNSQIVLTATQDVDYESESASVFTITGNPTKTDENTDVPKPISYPVTSSYIPINGEVVNLIPNDTVLLVKNVSSNYSGATGQISPGLENGKLFDNSNYSNNFKGMLDKDTGYFVSNQNAQLFSALSFNSSKYKISESFGHVTSNFEIDPSTIRKSYSDGGINDGINIVMDSDNKGFTYTIKDMPLYPNKGWAQYISFFVLTNSSSDEVTARNDYKITNELGETTQGFNVKKGIYGVNPEGKFVPRIIGEDTKVYTSDPKLDLLSLVKATDIKDGDITKSIKVENDGEFNQSKIGNYSIIYSVTNSDGVTTKKTITITVLYKDAKPVTVNYVDEEGNTLSESDTLNGKVGLPY